MAELYPKTNDVEEITCETFVRPRVDWIASENEGRGLCPNEGTEDTDPVARGEMEDWEGREGDGWDDSS
jgi:hypothetical protein